MQQPEGDKESEYESSKSREEEAEIDHHFLKHIEDILELISPSEEQEGVDSDAEHVKPSYESVAIVLTCVEEQVHDKPSVINVLLREGVEP